MPRNDEQRRRTQLSELLGVIHQQPQFAKRDIQSKCGEAKPAFVTSVLKQLARDGLLNLTEPGGDRYCWTRPLALDELQVWIERQIAGNQVTQAPLEERPRERLLEVGAENLKTSELLAILIRSGRKGESAVQAGQKVSNHVQARLRDLPDLSATELKKISSAVSSVAYCQIMAGIELGRRVEQERATAGISEKLNSTAAAKQYCRRHFARLAQDADHEEFHIVTLDTKLQPIKRHRITVGTLDASLVHPREVFKAAIRDSASSILLVHNHPSGDPTPSRQDHEVTERLRRSGELLGIQVVDHIIVAGDTAVSVAEQ